MHIKNLWRKVNISTLLILPLFSDMTEDTYAFKSKVKFPLIQLAYEYGLLQTYLYSEFDKRPHRLHLVFDRKTVIQNMVLTDGQYYSLSEMLIDYKFFNSLLLKSDYIVYTYTIPRYWRADVSKIIDGRYSEVSLRCKETLRIKDRFPTQPFVTNEVGHFIVEKNLPYAIVMKAKKLREDIEDIIKQPIPQTQEYFDKMDLRRETLSTKSIEKLWQQQREMVES